MMSLPVPFVLLLLVGHAAGQQDLVSVVALGAGGVLLNIKRLTTIQREVHKALCGHYFEMNCSSELSKIFCFL